MSSYSRRSSSSYKNSRSSRSRRSRSRSRERSSYNDRRRNNDEIDPETDESEIDETNDVVDRGLAKRLTRVVEEKKEEEVKVDEVERRILERVKKRKKEEIDHKQMLAEISMTRTRIPRTRGGRRVERGRKGVSVFWRSTRRVSKRIIV